MGLDRPRFPPIESLRALEASVRHGSFTRAADELCVTTAAISLRIRELQSELGATLFNRSGPRVTPTPAGVALSATVGEVLQLLQRAIEECGSQAPALRLTVVPTFGVRWLAPRLARYESSPGAIAVVLDVSAELRRGDAFDIAVRTGLGQWPGLEAIALLPIEATPMLSPALAASTRLSSPADLARLPLVPHDASARAARDRAGVCRVVTIEVQT